MRRTKVADTRSVRFRMFVEASGLIQRQLIGHIGTRRDATVSAWYTGATEPDEGTLRLLADFSPTPYAAFRWLMDGGEMPTGIVNRPYAASFAAGGTPLDPGELRGPHAAPDAARRAKALARLRTAVEEVAAFWEDKPGERRGRPSREA